MEQPCDTRKSRFPLRFLSRTNDIKIRADLIGSSRAIGKSSKENYRTGKLQVRASQKRETASQHRGQAGSHSGRNFGKSPEARRTSESKSSCRESSGHLKRVRREVGLLGRTKPLP